MQAFVYEITIGLLTFGLRQLVNSTQMSGSTNIWSVMIFLVEIEAGVMNRILCQ